MELKRDSVRIYRPGEDPDDDGFIQAEAEELFELVWPITADVWAFGGKESAERRLQRDVANLVRRKS